MTEIGIGIVGGGYMGKAHAVAMSAVGAVFNTTLRPRLEMVCAQSDASAERYRKAFGFARATSDWAVLVADPKVEAIIIASPQDTHRDIAMAAFALNKPVFCEKPLGASLEDSRAMAAASVLPDALVIASDIDEVAVDVAVANVAINHMEGRIECLEAAGFGHPRLAEAAPFDLVFANILKGPLAALAPDMASHLQEGGYAILSGILNEQADEIIEIYAGFGINLVHREEIVDWTTLTLSKNL